MRSKTGWLFAFLTLFAPACADERGLEPLVLPVAAQGEEDKADDPGPRVIVNLMASREMRYRGERIHLTKLGAILKELRQERGESLDGPSRLFVLIRADRDVEWRRVLWIMTVCAENRVYKFQLGVKRVADRAYTSKEARELGIERRDVEPPKTPRLEGKLSLPLRGWIEKRNVISYEVDIHRTREGETVYRFPERKTTDLKTVRAWAAEAWKAVRAVRGVARVAKIRADGDTPLRYVVAAISKLREAGWLEIDYFVTSIPKADFKKPRYHPWK